MPSGKTHDRITLILLPPIVLSTLILTRDPKTTLALSASYLFSGLMFGPDLDIHSVQYKRWGYLRWMWLPYRQMIRHRGILSHGIIIGTLFRLFYLGSFLLLITTLVLGTLHLAGLIEWNGFRLPEEAIDFCRRHPTITIAIPIGLELGSMSHIISDRLGSAYKRSKKRSKTRKSRPR